MRCLNNIRSFWSSYLPKFESAFGASHSLAIRTIHLNRQNQNVSTEKKFTNLKSFFLSKSNQFNQKTTPTKFVTQTKERVMRVDVLELSGVWTLDGQQCFESFRNISISRSIQALDTRLWITEKPPSCIRKLQAWKRLFNLLVKPLHCTFLFNFPCD